MLHALIGDAAAHTHLLQITLQILLIGVDIGIKEFLPRPCGLDLSRRIVRFAHSIGVGFGDLCALRQNFEAGAVGECLLNQCIECGVVVRTPPAFMWPLRQGLTRGFG